MEKVKDQTLRNDSFDLFLKILNKFQRVSSSEQAKELWKLLDENITKIIAEDMGESTEQETKKEKKKKGERSVEDLEGELAKANQQIRDLQKKSEKVDADSKTIIEKIN